MTKPSMLEERIVLWFMRDLSSIDRLKFYQILDRPCSTYLAGQQKDLRGVLQELRAEGMPDSPVSNGVRT